MKFSRLVGLVALTTLVSLAAAQEIHNWRSSVTGSVWKDASGQCWRDGSWTPATAAPECDGAIASQPAVVASPAPVVPAPEPTPVPVPAPAAAPAAEVAVEPAPAPMNPVALQAAPEMVAAAENAHVPVVAEPSPQAVEPAPSPQAVEPAPKSAPAPEPVSLPAAEQAPLPAAAVEPAPAAPAPAAVAAPAPAAQTAPAPAKMSFAADAFFDFDKSVLKPEGKAKLKELVEKIKNISLEVVIAVGHTDSVGTDAYNLKLSQRRAEAVKAYLVSLGVPKNRIYTEGKGESEPAADNKTAAGRAKNRRVEVEVVGSK